MSYDIRNTHLVALDVSAKGRIVVAMPPRGSFTKEQALMYAAWLVTTADASEGVALDHHALAASIAGARARLLEQPEGGLVFRDTAQGVTCKSAAMFLHPDNARDLASELVATGLDGSDLAPFFERVAAVHDVVKDGSELNRLLKEEGEPVNLRPPVKRIDVAADLSAALKKETGDDYEVGELHGSESPTDAGRRRTVTKP